MARIRAGLGRPGVEGTSVAALAAALFIGGAILGSFATALAHRLPRSENWVSERSKCPSCGETIGARDNIPVASWMILRGRCRSCGEPISPRYVLAELVLGALFAATYLIVGGDEIGELLLGLVLCFVLVVVTLTDLDLRIIPNKIVLAGSIVAVAIAAITVPDTLDTRAISAAIAGGLMFLLVLAYPRGMGMGDAKLVGMMALFIGRAIAPATLIGFLLGAIVGVAMIARQGAQARKSKIPFGPFLAAGGVIGLWFGDDIVQWYLDEFFPA
jgi:leader peptidase (prepilin peptidase) / N-methyltransferase